MKKKFLQALSFLTFVSCTSTKDDLNIVLLNNEVICVENVEYDVRIINEKDYVNNIVYDSLSRNILDYKLTNNSNKKYFIYLNSDNLDVMENNLILGKLITGRIGKKNGISFNLYRNDSIISGRTTLTTGGQNLDESQFLKSSPYWKNVTDSIFIHNAKIRKLYGAASPSTQHREILKNCFVLYPGETKYFTSEVHLPLRKDQAWISKIDPSSSSYASLSLVNIADKTSKHLSKNQKKEIEENEYTIYNGILHSNSIPVKFVKIPAIVK